MSTATQIVLSHGAAVAAVSLASLLAWLVPFLTASLLLFLLAAVAALLILRSAHKRKREEAVLREREEWVRLLLESTGEGIYGLDYRGICTFCNRACLRLLGYAEAAALLGKNLHDLTHHTHADGTPYARKDCRILQALWRGEGVHVEDEILWRADGTCFPAEYWSYPVRRGGEVAGVVVTFLDRSERRQAEQALRASEERFRQLADNIEEVFWLADLPSARLIYVSPAYEKVWGRSCASLYEQPRSFLEAVHPEDRERMVASTLGEGREKGFTEEFRIYRPDGAVRWIRVRGIPIHDERGQSYRLAGIAADITQLKESQRQAVEAERLAAIGQVVASIAHESGNALQGVQSCLERLALRLQEQPQTLDLVERAQKGQDRLQRLYEDVRRYAAPIRLDPGECRLDEIWRSAWTQLTEEVAGRWSLLAENTAGVDLSCTVDGFRLEQVFRNVFDNALAACVDPVQIEVHCAEAEIEGRPALRIRVRDNGPGLTTEQRQKMFEPFYTTKTKGTGLGLAISKRLVEAHGGHITAGEVTGRGAEIILTLPRRQS